MYYLQLCVSIFTIQIRFRILLYLPVDSKQHLPCIQQMFKYIMYLTCSHFIDIIKLKFPVYLQKLFFI